MKKPTLSWLVWAAVAIAVLSVGNCARTQFRDESRDRALLAEAQAHFDKGDLPASRATIDSIKTDPWTFRARRLEAKIYIQEENERMMAEARVRHQRKQEQKAATMRSLLVEDLERVKNTNGLAAYLGSVSAVLKAVEEFEGYAGRIQAARKFERTELNQLAEELETRVSKVQADLLPQLRAEYAANTTLRIPNFAPDARMSVSVSGTRSKAIIFTGPVLFAGMDIDHMERGRWRWLEKLRFSSATYRTHASAPSFRSVTFQTPEDTEPYYVPPIN